MTAMLAVLRRHGATIGKRHGRWVPLDFGSVAAEEAVCRRGVGLVERSDRAMLEIRGADVDPALGELASLGDHAWWVRLSARRAIVRCERPDEDACIGAMRRAEDVAIVDIAAAHAALTVVGPLADAVLRALDVEQERVVLVVRKDPFASSCSWAARRDQRCGTACSRWARALTSPAWESRRQSASMSQIT